MKVLIFSFLISLIITYLFTPVVKRFALAIGAIDVPGKRRINSRPVPTIGGLAIYGGFSLAAVLFLVLDKTLMGIMVGGTFILILGLIDDLYEISPLLKLLGQIMGALILIFFGVKIEFITNPFGGMIFLGYWGIPLTIIWVVGVTNMLNLIDGLDGLAAGVSAIAALTLFFVALQENQFVAATLAVTVAGSTIGFLRYNFHPAEIFMGDAGAMFLGFILAAVSVTGALKSAAAVTLIVPVLALGIPIFDTVFAIIRRLYHNRPISKADHGHIHHRLLALGWSQAEAVLIVYVISMFLGLSALIINGSSVQDALVLLGVVVVLLIAGAWKLGIFTVELPAEGVNLEKSNI